MPALAEQNDPIEAAPVDEGMKLVVRAITEHMKAQSKINADGHARTAAAIDRQTDRMEKVTRDHVRTVLVIVGLAFGLVVFAVGGFMLYVGVNPREAAAPVPTVLAGQALPVAASPPPEE